MCIPTFVICSSGNAPAGSLDAAGAALAAADAVVVPGEVALVGVDSLAPGIATVDAAGLEPLAAPLGGVSAAARSGASGHFGAHETAQIAVMSEVTAIRGTA